MGNECQTKAKPIMDKPPMLNTIPRTGTGFNSYDYDRPSPNSSVGIDGYINDGIKGFKKIIDDTLRQFNQQEVDDFVKSVMDDVSIQYSVQFHQIDSNDTQQSGDSKSDEPDPSPSDKDIDTDNNQQNNNKARPTQKAEASPKPNANNKRPSKVDLSFVPKENIVTNITSVFQYMKQLGKGASCRVLKARHLENQKLYAVKELTKKHPVNAELFRKECELLRKFMHPNVLRYFNCYIDDNCYYIATEFCSGGTMLDKIIRMKSFSEAKASDYIRIILQAVGYMHELDIVHRDLKAQNMVFDKHGKDGVLQLIDFGDSAHVKENETYNEFVGTIHYVPPEIVRPRTGEELKKSDVWSVGVIAYLLVVGRPPFSGRSQKEILTNIISKKKKLAFPQNLTKSCKDFITKLLCDDPKKRLSAMDALMHEWICGKGASTHNILDDAIDCLKRYHYNNKLQDILVNAILTEMGEEEQDILTEGILQLNRQESHFDGNSVVDYLLLHSAIDDEHIQDKEWRQQRINEVRDYAANSEKRLTIPHSKNPSHFNGMDWDILEGIDVDVVLDEVDKKEQEFAASPTQPSVPNKTKPSIAKKTPQNGTFHYVTVTGAQTVDYGDDSDDNEEEEEEEEEEFLSDDEYDNQYNKLYKDHSLHANHAKISTSQSVDMANKRISIGRFKAIMDKSNKKYDVDHIVEDLDDGTGHIALKDIATYTKRIETMTNVFDMQKSAPIDGKGISGGIPMPESIIAAKTL